MLTRLFGKIFAKLNSRISIFFLFNYKYNIFFKNNLENKHYFFDINF